MELEQLKLPAARLDAVSREEGYNIVQKGQRKVSPAHLTSFLLVVHIVDYIVSLLNPTDNPPSQGHGFLVLDDVCTWSEIHWLSSYLHPFHSPVCKV